MSTALSRESVRQMMARKHVAYLKGELTDANSAVSATLQQFGRQGLPLYLLYCPGMNEPEILPERLTEEIVLSALSSLPDRGVLHDKIAPQKGVVFPCPNSGAVGAGGRSPG